VVNEEALPDGGAGVNLDAGKEPTNGRKEAPEEFKVIPP
jgi:hypothetical protein